MRTSEASLILVLFSSAGKNLYTNEYVAIKLVSFLSVAPGWIHANAAGELVPGFFREGLFVSLCKLDDVIQSLGERELDEFILHHTTLAPKTSVIPSFTTTRQDNLENCCSLKG